MRFTMGYNQEHVGYSGLNGTFHGLYGQHMIEGVSEIGIDNIQNGHSLFRTPRILWLASHRFHIATEFRCNVQEKHEKNKFSSRRTRRWQMMTVSSEAQILTQGQARAFSTCAPRMEPTYFDYFGLCSWSLCNVLTPTGDCFGIYCIYWTYSFWAPLGVSNMIGAFDS